MATLRFDRRRRNKMIDALTLSEVMKRLALFDAEDVRAVETIAKNVLKRHMDEQDDTLQQKARSQASEQSAR